jgi:hypothetical protein
VTVEGESSEEPDRFERIELRLEQLEDSDSNHLAVALAIMANDLRNAVNRIEEAADHFDSRLEKAVSAATGSTMQIAGACNHSSPPPQRISYRKMLAENWLQIASGMIIAIVAIVITVYLFSRAQ